MVSKPIFDVKTQQNSRGLDAASGRNAAQLGGGEGALHGEKSMTVETAYDAPEIEFFHSFRFVEPRAIHLFVKGGAYN
jgi:hypothetical protein